MLDSEKLGIAAHLHLLLRRKTGRVTDIEWMASNTEYAAEIVRFAHAKATKDKHPDMAEWADKLALALKPVALPKLLLAELSPEVSIANNASELGRYVKGIR
ncbi:MAG: hypothetical protein RL761_46 [Pseudomonadota bacterium]|jgi:hypothetical protein